LTTYWSIVPIATWILAICPISSQWDISSQWGSLRTYENSCTFFSHQQYEYSCNYSQFDFSVTQCWLHNQSNMGCYSKKPGENISNQNQIKPNHSFAILIDLHCKWANHLHGLLFLIDMLIKLVNSSTFSSSFSYHPCESQD
jgi:hypothetical protein